tara:strand:- start:44385 stop:45323 length:939 start_codon:yes stop_codon:yes gene_type:complete
MKKQAHHPICPKCAYDQSGVTATWEFQCPVQGTCPECGLSFAWGDVMNPSRVRLRWYSEHASSVLAMVTRSPATLLRLLLPWVFWRNVSVTHQIALRRLTCWVLMMWVALHAVMAIPFAYYNWKGLDIWLFGSVANAYSAFGIMGILAILSNALFSPIVHVVPAKVGLEVTFQGGGLVYLGSTTSDFLGGLFAVLGFSTLWLVVLLVIPTTRRIAKIRLRHIMRAYILSLLPAIMITEILRFESAYAMVSRITPSDMAPLGIISSILWLIVFWACAVRVGWGIRPAWLLIVLGSIAGLLGMLVFLLVPEIYW